MTCHETNKENGSQEYEEYDESTMMLEGLVEELGEQIEKRKPNMDETEIHMSEEDAKKTAFITPWGVYHFRVMPFSHKNAGATYMRAMTTLFHDMIHREIKVYVDDVIIKSRESAEHTANLQLLVKRKATAAQKGKAMTKRQIEREPPTNVEGVESYNKAPSNTSSTPPVLEEQEGASAPAPMSTVSPPAAWGQQKTEAIHLLKQLVADQAQR
ncbi:uncharacterized protein LOC132045322 [Lycium ferocissimum]|uniref:uncharacterized protein LOC132045322 n=1 Tax=Lycium ferocissimum TaxID=112874 RepID=UPI0028161416|nr:uncharacterized protein LOC132045322 [Lycium ferocissimum]